MYISICGEDLTESGTRAKFGILYDRISDRMRVRFHRKLGYIHDMQQAYTIFFFFWTALRTIS